MSEEYLLDIGAEVTRNTRKSGLRFRHSSGHFRPPGSRAGSPKIPKTAFRAFLKADGGSQAPKPRPRPKSSPKSPANATAGHLAAVSKR